MQINIIGAGRVGQTIAALLQQANYSIQSVYCQTQSHAEQAVAFIGAGQAVSDWQAIETGANTVTLITTPDDVIVETAQKLLSAHKLPEQGIVLHCSGVLAASAVKSVLDAQLCASMHPIRSFAKPYKNHADCAETCWALEGCQAAVALANTLCQALAGKVLFIDPAQKGLYHAGLAMASNYLVTLFAASKQVLTAAGVPESDASAVIQSLMQGTLTNIESLQSCTQALTGPIVRGDVETVTKHLADLKGNCYEALYQTLGQVTVEQLTEHEQSVKSALLAALSTSK